MDTLIDRDGNEILPVGQEAAAVEGIEPARLLLPGGERKLLTVVPGGTVADLMAQVPRDLWPYVQVYNHANIVQDWEGFRLQAGDRLLIAVTPQGGRGGRGKQIIGIVLTIVVAYFAPWAATNVFGLVAGTSAYAAAVIGISLVGSMLIGALIRPPNAGTGADQIAGGAAQKSYSLSGQSNSPRAFNACLVIYGQYKVMPALAANPNVDNYGAGAQISALYDFGLGYVNIWDVRIGDVPIGNYGPTVYVHTNSYCDDLHLAFDRLGYDQYAFALLENQPITVRTKPHSYTANMDIQFTRGMFQQVQAGWQVPYTADFKSFYRKVGTEQWNEVPIDWYFGFDRSYVKPPVAGIQFRLDYSVQGGMPAPDPSWHDYDSATSPALMREMQAAWAATRYTYSLYTQSYPNTYIQIGYEAPMDEGAYFARYPEIKAAGWPGSAQNHFESIGSREGRDPGVPVFVNLYNEWSGYYSTQGVPGAMHSMDKRFFPNDQRVGGWGWIDSGQKNLPQVGQAPFEWRLTTPDAFTELAYQTRYPDVSYAVNVSHIYPDGWTHFKNNGSFEGRNPYAAGSDLIVRLTGKFVGPYWMRIAFAFPEPAEYELKVTRVDKIEDGTDQTPHDTQWGISQARFNETTLMLLRSYVGGLPVTPRLRHTMLEMRVTATDQLTGVVQNLSALAISVLPVTNDGGNFWWAETRNPAWVCLDILTSEKNPKPLTRQQIDWPSWLHLAAVCDEIRSFVVNGLPWSGPRYTCDIVIDSFSTVKDLVESILSACRASMTLTAAGLWGVLLDIEKTTPRQLITPANSWGFSGQRTFTPLPHAFRVNFINADRNYVKDEVIVYNDGYSAGNATEFETLDTFGITDYAHAWSNGRYMLAQGLLRAELFTLSMDVENLLVQRGDLVWVAHDVPRVGGMPCRVITSTNGGATVQVDARFAAIPSGYAVRTSSNGWMRTGQVIGAVADDTYILDAGNISPDDLIVFGEFTRVTQPYLVQAIRPGEDLSAMLTLCKYDAGVYTADQYPLPPWDAGFGHDYVDGTDLVSFNLVLTQVLYYVNRIPMVDVQLTWQTNGWQLDHHEISVIGPQGTLLALDSQQWTPSFKWTLNAVEQVSLFEVPLQFQVMPVNRLGFQGVPAYASIVLVRDRTAPQAVPMFGVNVQKETVDISWQAPNEPDVAAYMLRYTPATEYPEWTASQVLATCDWPATRSSAGARTGSYGIRVIDTSGNIGPVVWRRTTVAFLPEVNVITVMNDALLTPPWPGQVSNATVTGREVMNAGDWGAVYPDAIYYCKNPIDLGEVYEARVSSKIEAYGLSPGDMMSNWVPSLADVTAMSHAMSADWDAWLEVRTANRMAMMSDWVPAMNVAVPIAGATDSAWTGWRPVISVMDITAQLIQFRICMQSRNPYVRPVVMSGRIEVDMPDRIESWGDVGVPALGLDFQFPVAFRYLEAVAITINGNANPVAAQVTNKTPEGFHLVLKNTVTGAMEAGYVDIMAEGYGRTGLTSI